MADSLWLGVKVVCGSRVLFGSKIVNCSKEETFGNLISRIQEEQFSERRVKRFGHVTFFIYFFTGHPGLFCDKLARATKHPVGLALVLINQIE